MAFIHSVVVSAFVTLLSTLSWAATHQASVPNGQVELMTEYEFVAPGAPLRVGVLLSLEKTWHTYWSNPGDSGATPIFAVSLPKGFEVSAIQWPTPKRIVSGPLTTFGHEDATLFWFQIIAPKDLKPGRKINLVVNGEFLICADICVPGPYKVSKELKVETISEGSRIARSGDAGVFDRAQRDSPALIQQFEKTGDTLRVGLTHEFANARVLDFFPFKDSGLEAGAKPAISIKNGVAEVKLPAGAADAQAWGVLQLQSSDQKLTQSFAIGTTSARGTTLEVAPAQGMDGLLEIFGAVFAAFLGGLLLNLMPCVFPVVSIKLFGLLKHGAERRREIRNENLAYSAGVIVTFLLIAGLLAGLKAAGTAVGWGFQLQSPWILSSLTLLFVALAFNFLGFFEIPGIGTSFGSKLAQKEGSFGAFFSGALCVVVASPCTAPFMGASIGFAMTQPIAVLALIFIALGVGLSFPYLLVAAIPGLVKMFPRPGAWMERFKEFLAFPMFATALWLLWLVGQTQGSDAMVSLLTACLFLGLAVWASRFRGFFWRFLLVFSAALSVGIAIRTSKLSMVKNSLSDHAASMGSDDPMGSDEKRTGLQWKKFTSRADLEKLRAQGAPIFVDFTADWCLTCKVNERVTFGSESTRRLVEELGLTLVKADWTTSDPEITAMLEDYGRIGVPFYLVFVPGEPGRGHVLPEVLTPAIFERELRKALSKEKK